VGERCSSQTQSCQSSDGGSSIHFSPSDTQNELAAVLSSFPEIQLGTGYFFVFQKVACPLSRSFRHSRENGNLGLIVIPVKAGVHPLNLDFRFMMYFFHP